MSAANCPRPPRSFFIAVPQMALALDRPRVDTCEQYLRQIDTMHLDDLWLKCFLQLREMRKEELTGIISTLSDISALTYKVAVRACKPILGEND